MPIYLNWMPTSRTLDLTDPLEVLRPPHLLEKPFAALQISKVPKTHTMSFGFSIGDFLAAGNLAWSPYKQCKGASAELQEACSEVLSLHTAI